MYLWTNDVSVPTLLTWLKLFPPLGASTPPLSP